MPENDQEKTEQPSSRRRDQARQDGNFATSKEVSSFFSILGAITVLYFSGTWVFMGAADFMKRTFQTLGGDLTPQTAIALFHDVSYKLLILILPALAIPVFGVISYVVQNGINLTGKPLTPDINKINPLAGVKRLFSLNSVAELVKSILKLTVITYVVYVNVRREWANIPFLMDMELVSVLSYMGAISFRIMTKTVWVLAFIAGLDYLYQRWSFEKGLRMSKDELKEEMKETEGDPHVRARIKSIQRELARKRMMQDVPTADVVVTNPTHLSVAIRYDRSKSDAPVVVAKGAGHLAQRIRELAREHDVPLVENKPLARHLYRHVEVGMQVPMEVYKAVAEVLAYVYRLKGKFRNN
ncbi:MAG: flagellar biosynthesis protein FlhB [Thermodesulfobacteriota bacterium]